ncbi:MAG: hypothetical protein ACR2QF_08770 [Geminicoccaceae bacterium]
MKKLSKTADQIVDAGDVSNPELIKVDIQVRSGGRIDPPPWLKRRDSASEPKRSTDTLAERK